MVKLNQALLFVFYYFLISSLNAQEVSEKKRLQSQIDTTTIVKNKVQLYADLAWEYTNQSNDSSLIYSNKALTLSKGNKYNLGEALALESIGLYYEIAEGDFDKASKNYFDALKICEANKMDYEAEILHTIGVMFHLSDNYEKGREYYELSYKKALNFNNLSLQKKSLINLGAVYSSLNQFKKAEETMLKTLTMDIHPEMDYTTYANLGYYYVKQKDFTKALEYLEKATEQHPDNPESEINLYHLINAKVKAKDITNMDAIIKRAKLAISQVTLRDKSLLLRNIADYYELKGDYKEAINMRNRYIEVYEVIKEKQRDNTVLELQTKYETEKKDAELKILTVENEKKEQQTRLLTLTAISGLCIAGLLGFFGYKNRKKNIKLAKQKQLLEDTLDEKNTLLKEVHHRVKNSFQIVSSLLYLQSENIEDKEAKLAIKEAENRVKSMVLVHQKLYNKEELVGINTEEYITDLVTDIFESHSLQKEPILYNINIEPVILDIETITPLGLILNELIINTIKHAFTGNEKNNTIDINFSKTSDKLVLQIADNGKGFEGDIKQTSFGITLIKALSKQLKAKLNYNSKLEKGTQATLTISKFNILT